MSPTLNMIDTSADIIYPCSQPQSSHMYERDDHIMHSPAEGHLCEELYDETPANLHETRSCHCTSLRSLYTSELAELSVDSVTQTAETSSLIITSITSAKIPSPHSFLLIDHTSSKI